MGVDFSLSNRDYTTEKSDIDDPYHSAREETKVVIDQFIQFEIIKDLDLIISYEHTKREAESAVYPEISKLKNYSRNSVNLALSFNINEFELWR